VNKDTNDTLYEGRDKVSLDVDRMINEGLAGGKVQGTGSHRNIEEARNFHPEDKPYTTK